MAIKFNKDNKVVKARTSKPGKLCTITLTIQIVLTVILGVIAFAPFLAGFGGFLFGAGLVAIAVVLTAPTAGVIWASKGVRDFFGKAFNVAGKMMKGTDTLINFLKPHIIYIALPLLFVSTVGFIYNLIYFIKHEKANKGRFITSCIFLGLAIINLIVALVVYLTFK